MSIKAIGFDYGGVIAGVSSALFDEQVSKVMGVSVEDFRAAYFKYNQEFNGQKITLEQLWQKVLVELDRADKMEEVRSFMKKVSDPAPRDEMLDLLKHLREQGYKIGILTNNPREAGPILRSAGIQEYCDTLLISGEIGFSKPDPKAFNKLLEELGVEASQLVFIDDSPQSLATADEVGYIPVQFIDRSDLMGKLKKLGVEV